MNNEPLERWSNRRILTMLALGTLIVSAIWHAPQEASYLGAHMGELIITLVLSMALTYLLRPGVNTLHRTPVFGRGSRGGRMWATLAIFALLGVLLWSFLSIGLRPVRDDARDLKDSFVALNKDEKRALVDKWQQKLDNALKPLTSFDPKVQFRIDREVPRAIVSFWPRAQKWLLGLLSHLGFIVELLLVPVLVFYFLCDGPAIRSEVRLLTPPNWRARGGRMLAHLDRVLDGYIRGQMIMCLVAWVLVTLGLWALGVPHAFTMGLLAGLTRAVPVVGPLLGGIPIALVCLVTTGSVQTTMIVLVGFMAMHFLESKVLLPKIIGHEVDLHPVSVIVALLLGLEFFGFLGVFLAVPVAAVFKIVLTEWHDARLAQALAASPPSLDAHSELVSPGALSSAQNAMTIVASAPTVSIPIAAPLETPIVEKPVVEKPVEEVVVRKKA